jgi:hypothetical protein
MKIDGVPAFDMVIVGTLTAVSIGKVDWGSPNRPVH